MHVHITPLTYYSTLQWLLLHGSHTDGTSTLLHLCIILITTEVTSACSSLKTLFKLGITKITKIVVSDSQLKRVVLKFVKIHVFKAK